MIEAWGEDGLIKYDSAAVDRVPMPEESKRKVDPAACEGDTAWKQTLVEIEYGI